jgi:recombination associated protein RdgC
MLKSALLYRLTHWPAPTLSDLESRLEAARFVPCGATQPESAGWIAPRGDKHGALAESVAGQLILRLCTETKAVPAQVVKSGVDERLDLIEQQTGRRPRGKLVRELKEEIVHDLLPRAFAKQATTWIWVDAKAGWLVVGAASAKKADGIVTRLVEMMRGELVLAPVQTQLSPATAMADWLASRDAPAGFSIDRECELKQPDSEKSAVRYARHTLDIEEVGEHIRQGKLPTQLALTWAGRVSFVLTETLALKKIKLLDVAVDGGGGSGTGGDAGADSGFDADVAITTGELSRLIPDLIDALGGEMPAPGAEVPPSAASASPTAPSDAPSPSPAAVGSAPWDPVPA